jgi:DNA-binding beta-propeller fold protein YncE
MRKILFMIVIAGIMASCNKPEIIIEEETFGNGAYIVCEGNFSSSNGDISYFNTETQEITNDIFWLQNEEVSLGDIVQSISFAGDYAFIAVNNSKKLEIVNAETFKHVAVIENISYPRNIIKVNDKKSYLTNGSYPGEIIVINNETFAIDKQIPLGNSPENLIVANNKVYVANGAWGSDNTISVINPETDIVEQTVTAADGATDLISDFEGNIWVLCGGKVVYDQNWNVVSETDSKIIKLNKLSLEKTDSLTIGTTGDFFNPTHISVDNTGKYIFFIESDGIYKSDISTSTFSATKIIDGTFYSLEINPANNNIFVFSDNGFTQAGTLNIYNIEGSLIKGNISTGIGPNGAVFK